MEGIVKLLGIVMVVAGVVYFIKPALMKTLADFITKDKWLYVGLILAFIVGMVFLYAASQCAIPWLVTVYGVLVLAKGLFVVTVGKQKVKLMVSNLIKQPSKTLRGFALIEIALGVILIYAA